MPNNIQAAKPKIWLASAVLIVQSMHAWSFNPYIIMGAGLGSQVDLINIEQASYSKNITPQDFKQGGSSTPISITFPEENHTLSIGTNRMQSQVHFGLDVQLPFAFTLELGGGIQYRLGNDKTTPISHYGRNNLHRMMKTDVADAFSVSSIQLGTTDPVIQTTPATVCGVDANNAPVACANNTDFTATPDGKGNVLVTLKTSYFSAPPEGSPLPPAPNLTFTVTPTAASYGNTLSELSASSSSVLDQLSLLNQGMVLQGNVKLLYRFNPFLSIGGSAAWSSEQLKTDFDYTNSYDTIFRDFSNTASVSSTPDPLKKTRNNYMAYGITTQYRVARNYTLFQEIFWQPSNKKPIAEKATSAEGSTTALSWQQFQKSRHAVMFGLKYYFFELRLT